MSSTFHLKARPSNLLVVLIVCFSLFLSTSSVTAARTSQPQRHLSHTTVASKSGTWSSTGSMSITRQYFTFTLLPNGQVLVAGGNDQNGNALASAELYNPTTGKWKPTGSMTTARASARATLLPTGQVLVTGGSIGCGSKIIASAELYNPTTGKWTLTGSMHDGRSSHSATLLPDGRVLVAGGWGKQCNDVTLASAEVYNPYTGKWKMTGSMNVARSSDSQEAVLLFGGNVLIAGGVKCCPYVALNSPELYNMRTGTWTLTGSMNITRDGHMTVVLPNGKVLVAGGATGSQGLLAGGETGTSSPFFTTEASAELYSPRYHVWKYTGSMTTTRYAASVVLLPSGLVLVAGGQQSFQSQSLASAELFNYTTGKWVATGSMITARAVFPSLLLPNGKVLVAGGNDSQNHALASAELYTP